MASTSRLFSGLPGTTAGPVEPPASIVARASSRSPPFCLVGPWHPWHRAARIGRTLFSKNSTAAGSVFSDESPSPACGNDSAQPASRELT